MPKVDLLQERHHIGPLRRFPLWRPPHSSRIQVPYNSNNFTGRTLRFINNTFTYHDELAPRAISVCIASFLCSPLIIQHEALID